MRRLRGIGLWAGGVLLLLVVAAVVVRTWAVPSLIVGALRARYDGRVTIDSWWINGSSAGVTGLALHETAAADSPVWARAERVATDLSLGGLLSGRFSPRKISLQSPQITFRIDRDGKPLTRPPLKGGGGGSSAVPDVIVRDARLTLDQQGRPAMVVGGVSAELTGGGQKGENLKGRADDPTWGQLTADGRFGDNFTQGTLTLGGRGVPADPRKVRSLPFVPAEVWEQVVPAGPVDVNLSIAWGGDVGEGVDVRTDVDFRGTTLTLPALGFDARDTTGRMTVRGGVVALHDVAGAAIDGRVEADGTLDFAAKPPRIDLKLDLQGLNIGDTPPKWKLRESGITGQLNGVANLRVTMTDAGADLTGSTGAATVRGATLGGIPVKSLKLNMEATGDELRYETATGEEKATSGRLAPDTLSTLVLLALQQQAAAKEEPKPKTGFILPKTIQTQLELEDVDLAQVLGKVEALGIHLPFPVAGTLSVKADATIPLGTLRDIKGYKFHGEATLKGASIAGVDLGHVAAKLDLEDGVLDLSDFRGQLVHLPEGGLEHRPEPTDPVPSEGPLPAGGFRGRLHAELSPPGRLTADFEGEQLPVGELAAPFFPRPTPVDGRLTLRANAAADVARLAEPSAWTGSGTLKSERITYRHTTLDALQTSFAIKDERLTLPDLAARLGGKPLGGRLELGLEPPYAFDGNLDVQGWTIADVLAFVPSAPTPAPADGVLTVRGEARGTLSPLELSSKGEGRIERFRVGPLPLGDVPFRWTTQRDELTVSIPEAHPFDGRISGTATVPLRGGGPVGGTLNLEGIDTAALAKALPGGGLELTGKADGRVRFALPTKAAAGESPLRLDVTLDAPSLTVQGIPASGLKAELKLRGGVLDYELVADSLGGKVKFKGEIPLAVQSSRAQADGRLQAVGFALGQVWPALGKAGAVAQLDGTGAIDANVRLVLPEGDLLARAVAEVRSLRWGDDYPLGNLRGQLSLMPAGWRLDDLTGTLFGGDAGGHLWGTTPAKGAGRYGFALSIERADLARVLGFSPLLRSSVQGTGAVQMAGRLDEVLRASGALEIRNGRVFGLPLDDLRAPLELTFVPGAVGGTMVVRNAAARVAGGRVRGDLRARLGIDRSYQTSLTIAALDLETVLRTFTSSRRPGTGKVSGRIDLEGPDPDDPRRARGRVRLDLDDASLVDVPVLAQLDRFLGSAGGGLFEDGDLVASVANGQLNVEPLTLVGRAVQLHAVGTVNLDGRLDLVVLVNTAQLIPETGQALLGIIPGLGRDVGREADAVESVGNFLSNRLLKFRVTGTVREPSVQIDPTVAVSTAAVGFFSGVLKLPLGVLR